MNFSDFISSINNDRPPNCSPLVVALWWDKKGDWGKSHDIAQDINSEDGSWVHAYLHRKEGDIWNADYWYSKAGKVRPNLTLDEEWESIVKHLIQIEEN